MVRRGQQQGQSEESDSDWDSLAQPADEERPPPPTPPALQQHPQQQRLPEIIASPLKLEREEPTQGKPTVGHDRRRSSAESSGGGSGRSIGRGPLTFIDRRQTDLEDAMIVTTHRRDQGQSPVTSIDNKSLQRQYYPPIIKAAVKETSPSPPTPDNEEVLPTRPDIRKEMEDVTDVEEIKFTHRMVQPERPAVPPPRRRVEDDVISRSSTSDGFDNAAFDGSSGKYSPPPVKTIKDAPGPDDERSSKVPVQQNAALPQADETIEIFPYDRIHTEFHQVSEKKRKAAAADRLSGTVFETSSRFWSEVAAVLGLPLVFLLAFLLQLLRFLTVGLLRPLLVGLLSVASDGLLKPLLAALHNAIVNPIATFLHNVASALKLILTPFGGILELLTQPLGRLFGSCRLVDIHHHHYQQRKPIHNV